MDPRDRVRPLPDGAACTACGAPVPTGRIRILARRDDVAFVELDCAACGSAALGLLTPSLITGGAPELDVASDPAGIARPRRGGAGRPVSDADVAAIRDELAVWDGDLVGWLATLEAPGRGGSVVDR
ncbi:MAG: hypothetical protein ABJC39_10970 [Chloroflexota bacterium]